MLSGYRFPIGPDGPVYSWLARWMGEVGLRDGPGAGPGVPALTLTLSGALRTGAVGAVTILGPVLAAVCGLAAGALVSTTEASGRFGIVAAVLLTGSFTAYLAGGWLANVTMVALFLSALAALAVVERSWRAVLSAAALLAAAGLAHRVFLAIGLVIVGGVILLHVRGATRAFRGGLRLVDTAAVRMALAAAGGAGGWLLGSALLTGGSIPGDTSQDGFFRRAGLRVFLLDRYRERLFGDLGRAIVPVAVGLGLGVAAADEPEPHGPGGRYLVAVCWTWGAVTAIGIVVLAVTGWGPPNRILQFAFFLPLVAAMGVAVLARRGRAPAMAAVLVTGAVMVASMVGWFRQSPAVTGQELAQVAAAGRAVSSSPADTPLVVLVDTAEPAAAYHVTRAGNVVRMGMPAERIDEMRLAVGSPDDFLAGRPTRSGDPEHDAASALYLEEARPLVDRATVLVLEPFNVKGYERALALGEEVARSPSWSRSAWPATWPPPGPAGAATRVGSSPPEPAPGRGGSSATRGSSKPPAGGGDVRRRGGSRGGGNTSRTNGVATQCSPNTMASHTLGARLGSATSSVIASATEISTAPPRAVRGRIQASGISHARYQGSRTGDTSSEMRLAHAIAPRITTASSRSRFFARWRRSTTSTQTNASGNATRTISDTTSPATSPAIAFAAPRRVTRTNRDGASQPWRVVSSIVPSVGSSDCMNGSTNGSATRTPTPTCAASWRNRRPSGRRSANATAATSSGTAAETLTRVPAVSAAVASSSRRRSTRSTAPATARPTRASLCPPATPWNTMTGLQPTRTPANAARSGAARRAAATVRTIASTEATAASALKPKTVLAGVEKTLVTPAPIAVNAGPYTERESIQSTETGGYRGSAENAAGITV